MKHLCFCPFVCTLDVQAIHPISEYIAPTKRTTLVFYECVSIGQMQNLAGATSGLAMECGGAHSKLLMESLKDEN